MSIWTDDRISRLKTLWLQGWSAQRVADDLGDDVSRNAVLGKVHRLNLSAGRAGSAPPPRAGKAAPSPPRATTAPRVVTHPVPKPSTVLTPAWGTATVLTVGRCDCRFPYGDPKASAFRLCGRPVERGAFCGSHAAIAYKREPQTPDTLLHLAELS